MKTKASFQSFARNTTLLMTALLGTLLLCHQAWSAIFTYTGASAYPGDWFNVTNWNPRSIPGPADTIFINGNVNIPNYTFSDLIFSGGNVQGSFTVGGTLHWSGGQLTGAITVASNALVRLGFASSAGVLSGVLSNHGTIVWPAGTWAAWVLDGGRLENATNGLFDMQLDGDLHRGPAGPGVFNNAGTFRKSGSGGGGGSGYGNFRDGFVFNNSGSVEVQSGRLRFTDGFTSSGPFSVATNTEVVLNAGTFHLLPGHVFTGPGTYGVAGNVVIDGPITEPRFRLSSGTLTISNEITGTLLWDRYATLAGAPTIASNGLLKVVNPGGSSGFPVTLSGVLTNYGLFLWPTGTYSAIAFDNGRLENMPGALVDLQGDDSFHVASGTSGVFNNHGTLRKSGGSGVAFFNLGVGFKNHGLVDVQSGTLRFPDGFTSSGQFLVPTNTAVELTGGTFHLLPGHLFTGAGTYGVFGNVVIDGPITEPNFQLDGGGLRMTNQITGTLVWRQGVLGGLPTIASSGVVRYVAGSGQWLSAGVLTNHGLFQWPAGAYAAIILSNARLENMPDGVVDMQMDGGFYSDGSSAQVNNAGAFRKSGGNGTGNFVGNVGFQNTGLLDVESGTLQVPGNSLLTGSRLNCGLRSPSDYGRVAFNGVGVLNGTLSASLIGGFIPMAGEPYQVISSGGLSGGFTSLSLPAHFFTTNTASSVFLVMGSGGPATLTGPALAGTNFTFAFQTEAGLTYAVEYNDDLGTTNWTSVETIPGDGALKSFVAPCTGIPQRFFRVAQP